MAEISLIDDIRAASRLMVRELGFMDATVAASDYPPSAVHTILEIGIRGPLTSGELGDFLRLEKSRGRAYRLFSFVTGGPVDDDARFRETQTLAKSMM